MFKNLAARKSKLQAAVDADVKVEASKQDLQDGFFDGEFGPEDEDFPVTLIKKEKKPKAPRKNQIRLSKILPSTKREHWIPKDHAAWLEVLVNLVKKEATIEYLNDTELRKVIDRARPKLAKVIPEIRPDPDAPSCINWDVESTGHWLVYAGFSYLKEVFALNNITGRKLFQIDCCALNKMGLTDLTEMRRITARIRDLLKVTQPNFMRALMRFSPYEAFLKAKISKTPETDALTFEQFCRDNGFNYFLTKMNKNALIPCTCEVRIVPFGVSDSEDEGDFEEDDNLSLLNAPTEEFVVRTLEARDKTIQYIIETMLENVFLPNDERQFGKILKTAFSFSDWDNMTAEERRMFAKDVALSLMDELDRTAQILADIQNLQKYIGENVSLERFEYMRECSYIFMEDAMPIVTLMALGELDLENIFKQEPEFETFVDGIVHEAEIKAEQKDPEWSKLDSEEKNFILDLVDEMVDVAIYNGDLDLDQHWDPYADMGYHDADQYHVDHQLPGDPYPPYRQSRYSVFQPYSPYQDQMQYPDPNVQQYDGAQYHQDPHYDGANQQQYQDGQYQNQQQYQYPNQQQYQQDGQYAPMNVQPYQDVQGQQQQFQGVQYPNQGQQFQGVQYPNQGQQFQGGQYPNQNAQQFPPQDGQGPVWI